MAELDDSVGQVRAALAAAGVASNTIVIFSSDNGSWNAMPDRMFGRDIVKPWDHGTPGPFRGGKAGTYEGGHRVPFLAAWPGRLQAGQVTDLPISIIDVFPTLAARAGLASKVPANVDGVDLWPTTTPGAGPSAAPPADRALFCDNGGTLEAIRQGPWKLRVTKDTGRARSPNAPLVPGEKVELFHLLNDPSERYDQSSAHPDVVTRLRARLTAEIAQGR
jgi:arylsulfatase A-like enzyme